MEEECPFQKTLGQNSATENKIGPHWDFAQKNVAIELERMKSDAEALQLLTYNPQSLERVSESLVKESDCLLGFIIAEGGH
ncbi:hypothetical protein AVEN_88942-1 [Araneus ventricosus]|uniref:Uncharacterized protein n=1 Tax=Araneus ventricosus TaxID=182803 RepID=A0A4Y2DLT1_ARAVE|nr:hypothetical protein AVEN_88942-1 [Araneus ventricosus]